MTNFIKLQTFGCCISVYPLGQCLVEPLLVASFGANQGYVLLEGGSSQVTCQLDQVFF